MERIALHTVLKEGKEAEYDRVHARIPDDLDPALRAAGVHSWQIWRDGRHLFHLVECEDYQAMRAALRDHPANEAWQATFAGWWRNAADRKSTRLNSSHVASPHAVFCWKN